MASSYSKLEDRYEVSANGMSVNRPAFIGMRGNLDLQFVEPRGSLHAIVTLGAGLQDREWFDTPDELCPFTPDTDALATVRSVTTGILQTASARPDLLQEPGSALALQEGLLLAIDEMFRSSRTLELAGRLASRSYCRRIRMDRRVCRRFMPPRRSTAPTSPNNAACRSERWARRWRAFAA